MGGILQRRIKLILLFPIFIFIFIVGWALYVAGDKRGSKNAAPSEQRGDSSLGEFSYGSEVEIGLIEEVLEEHLDD